jgi:hypothetical protein
MLFIRLSTSIESVPGVESVTYGMIDTIFQKSIFSSKNPNSTQYPCGFYDFSKIAIFDHPKKTIFVIAQNGPKAADASEAEIISDFINRFDWHNGNKRLTRL